jgi:AraC-like DNA-binding protein
MNEPQVRCSALHPWLAAAREPPPTRYGRRVDDVMPLADFVSLTERISAEARNPMLGWAVGLGFDLRQAGAMGEAVMAAKTLRGALQRVVDYFAILQDVADVRLEVAGEAAALCYRILDPDIWPRQQDALFTLGIFARILRGAVGMAWSDVEVVLEAGDATLRAEAARTIGAPCGFDGETNLIRFPSALLEAPMAEAQGAPLADHHARLARQVALRRRAMPVALRVRAMIFQDLTDGPLSQEGVARALGMSGRTLRRRLTEEGVSFQQLLDECRMRLAAFEFRVRRSASIAQTALRLGYSEHSTFTRAFSRWSGMPPRCYIQRWRSGGPSNPVPPGGPLAGA